MTHSLEVAQITNCIAIRLNSNSEFFKGDQKLAPDMVTEKVCFDIVAP